MIAETLREGFAEAHRHPGLILLDIIWKVVWLGLTLAGLSMVILQFVSRFEWQSTNIQALDAVVIANTLRQMWSSYGGEFLGGLIAVAGMSGLTYLLLEAVLRRKLVVAGFSPRPVPERGLKPATTRLFLASNLSKLALLAAYAIFVGLTSDGTRYTIVAGLVGFIGFAFFLTVLDTLLRTDAVDLLGVDLLGVTGLIGTLLLFETLIVASLVIVLVMGFLKVSSGTEALAMLAVTTLVLFVLNFLHSYLLVVRFSAVGIMKRNVIDV